MRKHIVTLTLMAVGLVAAHGQGTTDERAKELLETRVKAPPKMHVTNDWDAPAFQTLHAEIAAKPVAAWSDAESEFVVARSVWASNAANRAEMVAQVAGLARAGKPKSPLAAEKMVLLHATKPAEVAEFLALVPEDDKGSFAVMGGARRLNAPGMVTNWFNRVRAKGVSIPAYQNWFLGEVKALGAAQAQAAIRQEIRGLVQSGQPIEGKRAEWLHRLRLRLYIEQEVAE